MKKVKTRQELIEAGFTNLQDYPSWARGFLQFADVKPLENMEECLGWKENGRAIIYKPVNNSFIMIYDGKTKFVDYLFPEEL